MALKDEGYTMQFIGCIIGTVAIFLPSALLILFFFPVWIYLKKYVIVYRALEGINAVVVGLMWAAALFLLSSIPIVDFNMEVLMQFAVITGTFLLLKYSKTPAPLIVIACLLLGRIF